MNHPAETRADPLQLGQNHAAVFLGLGAVIALAVSLALPIMTLRQLGVENTYSMWGGIKELWCAGYPVLAGIIFAFSIFFPFLKLIGLFVVATTLVPMRLSTRRGWHGVISSLGRWSMLDVFASALAVVFWRSKDLMEVELEPGIYVFAAAVWLSIVAEGRVNLDSPEGDSMTTQPPDASSETEASTPAATSPRAPRVRRKNRISRVLEWGWVPFAIGLVLVAVALYFRDPVVESVTVMPKPGIVPDILYRFRKPSFLLLMRTDVATSKTITKREIIFGNEGVNFVLSPKLRRREIRHIVMWDGRELDHVDNPTTTTSTTNFKFTLSYIYDPLDTVLIVGWIVAGAGMGSLLLAAAIRRSGAISR